MFARNRGRHGSACLALTCSLKIAFHRYLLRIQLLLGTCKRFHEISDIIQPTLLHTKGPWYIDTIRCCCWHGIGCQSLYSLINLNIFKAKVYRLLAKHHNLKLSICCDGDQALINKKISKGSWHFDTMWSCSHRYNQLPIYNYASEYNWWLRCDPAVAPALPWFPPGLLEEGRIVYIESPRYAWTKHSESRIC